nr:DUF5131 family protein [Kofleriaceae bacterium]
AERLPEYFARRACPQNVWLGVSVEDKKYGVPRIDHLRKVDAHIRFLSVEPLLEDLGRINLRDIHWVIVGGESGPGARPMQPEWVAGIREQCIKANVAFFFKQWGGTNKKKAGRLLEGRTWDEMPTSPAVASMSGNDVDRRPLPNRARRTVRLAMAQD